MQLRNGQTLVASGTVNAAGVAMLSVSSLPLGSNVLRASYTGDAIYAPSASSSVGQPVVQAATTTTLVPLSPASVPMGAPVQPRIDVAAQFGTALTGQVSLRDGAVEILRPTLFNGSATLQLTNLSAGMHPLTAVYLGDNDHQSSPVSNSVSQTVSAVVATLNLSAAPPIIGPTRPATLRVDLTGASGAPTGTVSFRADGQSITTCSNVLVSAGSASCTTSFATAGSYAITADYSGDATYLGSSAGPLALSVSDPIFAARFE